MNYELTKCPYVFLKPRITRMWQKFDNSKIAPVRLRAKGS